MDEVHLLPDSDFSPNESGKRVDNGGVDRISELPNEIISVILSFLPLKTAVATSVLSSRWSDSWKHTPNLDFGSDIVPISGAMAREDVSEYMAMVNSILQSHKALSLKQFKICFYVNKSAKWAVTKWLEFIFLRRVESLVLDFNCGVDLDMVVLGESLREMNTIYGNPQTLFFFRSLKSLYLASLEVSGEDVELFVRNCLLLRNCPLLERLRMTCLTLTSDIEVCGPLLKFLEIYGCKVENSIKVSAPNLTVINFGDEGKLLFENVPRLVKATFDIRTPEFIMHHFASAASYHISQLQFLDISLNSGMEPHTAIASVAARCFWTNAFPHMPNLKKLNISSFEAYNHSLLQVTRLIWACPRLEEFMLLFYGSDEAPPANMQEIRNVGRSPHQHLQVFYLELGDELGLNDHVVELVTYVSNNCARLRQIEIVGVDVSDDSPRHELLQSQVPNHVQLWIDPSN